MSLKEKIKEIDSKKNKSKEKKSSVSNNECICDLIAKGENISGWCSKHRTDWL